MHCDEVSNWPLRTLLTEVPLVTFIPYSDSESMVFSLLLLIQSVLPWRIHCPHPTEIPSYDASTNYSLDSPSLVSSLEIQKLRESWTNPLLLSLLLFSRPTIRAKRSRVFTCRYSAGGVPHVVPAGLDLAALDTSENLIDVVPALSGKSASYSANFIHNRVTPHR